MADSATYTPEVLLRRLEMAKALLADPKKPITHWAEGLNELAKGALGGRMLGEADRQQMEGEKGAQAARMSLLGIGGGAPAAVTPPAATPLPTTPAAPAGISDRIVGAESGGDPTAVNPRSTASGPGQFIDSTWLETIKKNRPDLAAGKDDATLLAMRTDPAQAPLSREMTDAYAKQNAGTLSAAGQPVTPGTTYLAHFAGPGGATKILSADPATPVTALLSPAAIKANPHIANMTAGDLRAWADKKMGGDSAPPAASPAVGAIASALNGAPSGAPTAAAPAATPAAEQPAAVPAVAAALNAPAAPAALPGTDAKARIAAMLQDKNPYVRKQGATLADALIQKELIKDKPKYHKLNDEMLFEEETGKTKAAGPGFKPLVDPAERAAHGIPADDKRPYQVGPGNKLINPPAETRLNIDQRAEGAYDTAAAKHIAERHDKLVQAGMEAKTIRADVETLKDIGSRITTGKTAQITEALGPYAEALGVKIDGLGDLQAYEAITSKLAPRMRVAGSGATSDYEMKTFLKALPGLGKTPEGNALISNTMEALQDHQEKAAEIGSRALNKEITPREADKLLRELPDPMTAWRKNKGVVKTTEAPAVAGAPDAAAIEAEMKRRKLM